jgi:hypothetical protein
MKHYFTPKLDVPSCLQKSVQPTFSKKNLILQQYAFNVFFGGVFYNICLALLKNGHLYSCPFSPSDAISFLDFLESDRVVYLKGSQWGLRPRITKHYFNGLKQVQIHRTANQ